MANVQSATSNTAAGNSQNVAQSNIVADGVWNEERIEKAMKTLKEMHIQVIILAGILRY